MVATGQIDSRCAHGDVRGKYKMHTTHWPDALKGMYRAGGLGLGGKTILK